MCNLLLECFSSANLNETIIVSSTKKNCYMRQKVTGLTCVIPVQVVICVSVPSLFLSRVLLASAVPAADVFLHTPVQVIKDNIKSHMYVCMSITKYVQIFLHFKKLHCDLCTFTVTVKSRIQYAHLYNTHPKLSQEKCGKTLV